MHEAYNKVSHHLTAVLKILPEHPRVMDTRDLICASAGNGVDQDSWQSKFQSQTIKRIANEPQHNQTRQRARQ